MICPEWKYNEQKVNQKEIFTSKMHDCMDNNDSMEGNSSKTLVSSISFDFLKHTFDDKYF
jgi:hypothetical protein